MTGVGELMILLDDVVAYVTEASETRDKSGRTRLTGLVCNHFTRTQVTSRSSTHRDPRIPYARIVVH
jgi:hypothetical protein